MKYLIGLILSIMVIIFIIIKLLGSGGGDSSQTEPVNKSLASYADTATTVQFTIDNPVQAAINHNDIIVTVGRSSAVLTITRGYDGEVISSKSYPNSVNGYTNFLMGLQRSGEFTKGNHDPAVSDARGFCATGNRYIYEIIDPGGNPTQHLWSTSCGVKTFEGNISVTQRLFRAQIPDFNALTQNISF